MNSYKAPIAITVADAYTHMLNSIEKDTMDAVAYYKIKVDKEELLKALAYDRGQYEKGYVDGCRAAKDEIVHCKECKYGELDDSVSENVYHCRHHGLAWYDGGHFCGYGERKDDAENH